MDTGALQLVGANVDVLKRQNAEAIAGFNQLYLSNPIFGASIGDYFVLLAWGFGAEATSASVGKVMQRWGLPGNQ